jgi:hypothetical protein
MPLLATKSASSTTLRPDTYAVTGFCTGGPVNESRRPTAPSAPVLAQPSRFASSSVRPLLGEPRTASPARIGLTRPAARPQPAMATGFASRCGMYAPYAQFYCKRPIAAGQSSSSGQFPNSPEKKSDCFCGRARRGSRGGSSLLATTSGGNGLPPRAADMRLS